MEINYELEPKDLIAFNKYNAKKMKTHVPLVVVYSFVFIVFLGADFVYAIFAGWIDVWNSGSLVTHLIIRVVIWAALVGIVLLVFYLVQLKAANAAAETQKNGVFCPHKMILSEKELIEITEVNTSRYAWACITPIVEIEDFILVPIASSATHIIPKRYFKDREHIDEFVETAKQYRQDAESDFQLSHLVEYEKTLE